MVHRLQRDLIQPHYIHGQEVYTTASIGITLSSTGYESAETILRDADTAMYRAKQNGKARYELFDTNMHAEAVAMLRLESDLRRALDRNELRVFYQPIVSLVDEKIAGFEALVRWQHPTRGLIAPKEFIPTAEDTGLIIDIGQWVLTEACRQMQEWKARNLVDSSMTMSVNLSNKQFTCATLADQVKRILAETQLHPTFLNLEVTENVVTENSEQACTTLRELRDLGVNLSIDDFGTGYSSLSYLHRFPVHTLKIDRPFISNMSAGDENSAIVRTIISLAENLGMNVIAEGIETDAQRLRLKSFRCKYAQGYFFARPAPAASIETLLHNDNEIYGPAVKSDDAELQLLSFELQECTEYLT